MALTPTYRDPRVAMAAPYQRTKRVTRSPRHPFYLETRPFQIQPFMIAPVLPGETLTNLILQNRVYSDPIKSAHLGWWCEHWYFYVKHRDLAEPLRTDVTSMMLNPTKDMSAYMSVAAPEWFHAGGINWLKYCYTRVLEEYFRDQGETWDAALLGSLGLAQISGNNVLDSLTNAADFVDRDVNVDLDGDGKVEASELDLAYQQWQAMREAGLMDMDYEDFIRTYGVQVRQEETSPNLHRPEILRHVRTWTYPTNTIDPTNGTPRSAVSWAVAERADKNRFFSEPGFIIGLTCVRPKVYLANQVGSFAGGMSSALTWLPAVLNDNFELSYMHLAKGAGPLPVLADAGGYWVDTRDLFVHGEQFTNVAAPANSVALPTAAGKRRYAVAADIDALFVDIAKNKVHMDGVTTLSIKGRQVDHTPGQTL